MILAKLGYPSTSSVIMVAIIDYNEGKINFSFSFWGLEPKQLNAMQYAMLSKYFIALALIYEDSHKPWQWNLCTSDSLYFSKTDDTNVKDKRRSLFLQAKGEFLVTQLYLSAVNMSRFAERLHKNWKIIMSWATSD